jgi:dTDP-glucose 4,6-dehydratase
MDVIIKNSEANFIFSNDINNKNINTGIFIVKNTQYSKDFINRWLYDEELYNKNPFPKWWEQGVLIYMINNNTLDITKNYISYDYGILQHFFEDESNITTFNKPFIFHLSERSYNERINASNKYLNFIKKNTSLYSIDFPDISSTILFVTGGAGFIGSNFINEIFKCYKNIKVINFDALYYCADKNNIDIDIINDKARYTFIHGNLQSLDLLNYIFQCNPITHVLHFAAQSHVQTSFTDALQYTKDNVLGTHHLLEAARLYGKTLKKIIHVSTDEVYGESMLDAEEQHKTEQTILCPTNPYAATKAGAELIAQAYNHSFKMPIIITRGNNVYGPNQYPEKVIPRFIQQLERGEKLTIQGDGSCVRAFLHAYDTATAFMIILERGQIGEIYNIGCDEGMEYSILEVAKILIKKIKGTENYNEWITFIEDRPFNDQRYYIGNQKLKELGWNITINFNEVLNRLI